MKHSTNYVAATTAQVFIEEGAASGLRLYRLPDVLARIPISRSSWFAGIQAGRYPKGYHLGPRTTVWRSDDIERIILSAGSRRAPATWVSPVFNEGVGQS